MSVPPEPQAVRVRPNPLRVQVQIEVPFHDVDSLRIVWHGHYYKYFEIARTRLFRELGFDADIMTASEFSWVVTETRCRHSAPLQFGDKALVDCWLGDVDHRIRIRYEICNAGTRARVARGHTSLATLDAQGSLLFDTPPELLKYFAAQD